MDYIAYLHKDKGSDYGVSFPDFPGCVTAGTTLEEARAFASEAVALHIQGMVEDGDPVPEASSLDKLADDPDMEGAVAFLVHAEAPGRTVRFNVTAREAQLEAIDRFAEAAGMTRSAFLVQAALHSGEPVPAQSGKSRKRVRKSSAVRPAIKRGRQRSRAAA